MPRVTGIGGVFFKVEDPERTRQWYEKHLGIPVNEWGGWSFQWRDRDQPERMGRTEWGPFPASTDYFDPSRSEWMLNYRVDDLDGLLKELKAAGIWVAEEVQEYEYGKFGWIMDPDGNKIELWEPSNEEGQEA